MKIRLLLVSAIAIVGMAVYTLTLSFTNTTPLLSQLEALASGEGGESGGDSSESGNTGGNTEGENPESGSNVKYKMDTQTHHCQPFRWIQEPDGAGGYIWKRYPIGNGPVDVTVTICLSGTESDYNLDSCTPYDPCDPEKPTN